MISDRLLHEILLTCDISARRELVIRTYIDPALIPQMDRFAGLLTEA